MKYIFWLSILLSIHISCSRKSNDRRHLDYLKTNTSIDYNNLVKGFHNPPDQARMRVWWRWMNGLATKESITRDLEEFKNKGIGGILLMDSGNRGK
ncbi:MAG: glycosyl hydrolase, partial [Mangrovibacterium sp.]|nr:glycosyl hydrolase [Mangrovibacterium sp.]